MRSSNRTRTKAHTNCTFRRNKSSRSKRTTERRPVKARSLEDTCATEDPRIGEVERRLASHPAVVCIKWAAQRGQIPIPFSTNPGNYMANLRSVTTPPLTQEDMQALAS